MGQNRAMLPPILIRIYKIVFGSLVVIAIIGQLIYSAQLPTFNPVNFFSFFTILSNILAAGLLLYVGLLRPKPSRQLDLLRGGTTLYMVITGVVFALLLSHIAAALQLTLPWVNAILHQIMPIAVLADWLLDPPRTRITFRRSLAWLVFPLVYVGYTLLRGPIAHWYPYPFLDPAKVGGYPGVLLYCLGITLGTLIMSWILVQLAALRHRSLRS